LADVFVTLRGRLHRDEATYGAARPGFSAFRAAGGGAGAVDRHLGGSGGAATALITVVELIMMPGLTLISCLCLAPDPLSMAMAVLFF